MSEKRRDSKGRLLRVGEVQKPDGRYEYRYNDVNGVRRSVYSWRLVKSDKLPPGKHHCEPLRDLEDQISRDVRDGIDTAFASRTTLNDFYKLYIDNKFELKNSTLVNYKYMYEKYVSGGLGLMPIANIKYSDIVRFYSDLVKHGFKPNSVETIHTVLHPVFNVAVRDGYIRLNPTDGVLAELKKSVNWEKPKRHALTIEQQEELIRYVSESNVFSRWKNLFVVLLGTGMRIGECTGLRWQDCDFDDRLISVNHNLVYRKQPNGKVGMSISTPKTEAGNRVIPMLSEVYEALMNERERQDSIGATQVIVDGYSGFIFQDRYGVPLTQHNTNRAIYRIVRNHNAEAKENGWIELPSFSCHSLRHTFCTRFCENETNLKVIQEIMGHKNIETTMDIYNEATLDKKKESFAHLEGKVKIS